METMDLSTRVLYSLAINIGIGVVIGLAPLVFGFVRRQSKRAFLGFILTIVGSALLGLILAIPVAAIWVWLIYKGSTESQTASTDDVPAS